MTDTQTCLLGAAKNGDILIIIQSFLLHFLKTKFYKEKISLLYYSETCFNWYFVCEGNIINTLKLINLSDKKVR